MVRVLVTSAVLVLTASSANPTDGAIGCSTSPPPHRVPLTTEIYAADPFDTSLGWRRAAWISTGLHIRTHDSPEVKQGPKLLDEATDNGGLSGSSLYRDTRDKLRKK